MDKSRFDDDREVFLHYAESMAVTVFFLNFDNGRYRDPFLDYVAEAYKGRFRRGGSALPLIKRLGVPRETLERQFLTFLRGPEPATK